MTGLSFEQSLKIRQICPDTFESIEPSWTWPGGQVVPGGLLMAFAASAAYETLAEDWAIDTLQSHFLLAPDAKVPVRMKVQRLSDGGRFATRAVEVLQGGKVVCFVTCSFVRPKSLHGPSMTHSVSRSTDFSVEAITLDDLAPTPSEEGVRWMKFQRLGLQQTSSLHSPPSPTNSTYTSVGTIRSIPSSSAPKLHALGLLALSDYHVLDGPPHLHGLSPGSPAIGDVTQKATKSDFEKFTSLNHGIQFCVHEGLRADELFYVEVRSAWAGGRRGGIESRIFTGEGRLVACCAQEGYFVVSDKKEGGGRGESKI